MSNTLKIDLSKARFNNFKAVFNHLEKALKEEGIDFYVLGALARDMLFSMGSIATRTTADVDIAVYINTPNKNSYDLLRINLINNHQFTAPKNNSFAIISPSGVIIDLLPFGEIEIEDGVSITGQGLSTIKVNGFKEVNAKGLQQVVSHEIGIFKLAKLSSIIMLKLIAFNDRPEVRTNDPEDVASIIAHYFDLNATNIYENHNDLFKEEEVALELIAAYVIGREIKKVLNENQVLQKRVIGILENHILKEDKSTFILGMIGDHCTQVDDATQWLSSILKGIKEK
ncbi:MAG: hypothetical protein L3J06_04355 [Cyclobacteriaceae bacterium]|nr:hypothetical protein [Cyclobacteriaceae bacterium]